MKSKVQKADDDVKSAVHAREEAQSKITEAQKGVVDAAQQISAAVEARHESNEKLKTFEKELTQARRQEAAAERISEKALNARASVQIEVLSADENKINAVAASTAVRHQVRDLEESLRNSE